MTKIQTPQLIGPALEWAVTQALGLHAYIPAYAEQPWVAICGSTGIYRSAFTTDWSAGGPIIEMEKIGVWTSDGLTWHSKSFVLGAVVDGPTPLISAMRCFVASKLGNEVDIQL